MCLKTGAKATHSEADEFGEVLSVGEQILVTPTNMNLPHILHINRWLIRHLSPIIDELLIGRQGRVQQNFIVDERVVTRGVCHWDEQKYLLAVFDL